MANYTFSNQGQEFAPNDLWDKSIRIIQVGSEFQSVGRNPKTYIVESVDDNLVNFSGGDRKETEGIDRISFVDVITKLKTMKVFNTNSSKKLFKGTNIYAKRSPFFGLLLSNGIIEKL